MDSCVKHDHAILSHKLHQLVMPINLGLQVNLRMQKILLFFNEIYEDCLSVKCLSNDITALYFKIILLMSWVKWPLNVLTQYQEPAVRPFVWLHEPEHWSPSSCFRCWLTRCNLPLGHGHLCLLYHCPL